MCFSAEASFTASFILGAIGYATLKMNASKSQFFLAAIPCLFAIQQFSEGTLWIALAQDFPSAFLLKNAERSFLIFAFLIWPIWIPYSLVRVETSAWRRNVLVANLACGIMVAFLNLTYALKQDIAVKIVNHSIQYFGQTPPQTILYPLVVLLPSFISSYKNIWILGVLSLISYLVADYYYHATFISVWCFFAGFISLCLYKIIKDNQTSETKENIN